MIVMTKYTIGENTTLVINFEYSPYDEKTGSGPKVDINCIYVEGQDEFIEDDIQSNLNETTLDCIEAACFEAVDRIKKHTTLRNFWRV